MVRIYSNRKYKYTDTELFECVCSMANKDVFVFVAHISDGQVYDITSSVIDYHNHCFPLPELLREQRTFITALEAFVAGYTCEYLNSRSSRDDTSIF